MCHQHTNRRRRWDPAFARKRSVLAGDVSYVDEKATLVAAPPYTALSECIADLDFWGPEAVAAYQAAELAKLFKGVTQADLDEPTMWPGEKRAWVDERASTHARRRPSRRQWKGGHEGLMSAQEVFGVVMTPVRVVSPGPGVFESPSNLLGKKLAC